MRDFDDHDVEYAEAGERTADSNDVAEQPRRGSHREIHISRTVYRDGSPVTIEEVLVIEDDGFEADDEPRDAYEHELWWTNLLRGDLRAISGRWRGRSKLHARKRYCLICGTELDVKPRGRPPKTCGAAHRKQLERRLDAMSRNAPTSRGTARPRRARAPLHPEDPDPVCTCAEIRRARVKGRCALHGLYFNPPSPAPAAGPADSPLEAAPPDTSGALLQGRPTTRLRPLA